MKILALILLSVFPVLAGGMAEEFFEKANRLYEKGEYDSAALYYRKILDMNLHDAGVYYNLGNSYFRKNRIGPAILNFEIAHQLDPSDEDIAGNLRFAKASTVDKIPPRQAGFFEKRLWNLHNLFSISTQATLFLVLLYLLSIFVVLHFKIHVRFKGLTIRLIIISGICLALLSISFFYKVYTENTRKEAVVLSAKINAVNEPDGSQILFSVHEGAKFILSRKVGEWYFAGLENGVSGWIHENDLGMIELP